MNLFTGEPINDSETLFNQGRMELIQNPDTETESETEVNLNKTENEIQKKTCSN